MSAIGANWRASEGVCAITRPMIGRERSIVRSMRLGGASRALQVRVRKPLRSPPTPRRRRAMNVLERPAKRRPDEGDAESNIFHQLTIGLLLIPLIKWLVDEITGNDGDAKEPNIAVEIPMFSMTR